MRYYNATYEKILPSRYRLPGLKLNNYVMFRIAKETNDILIHTIHPSNLVNMDKVTFKKCFKIVRNSKGTPEELPVQGAARF